MNKTFFIISTLLFTFSSFAAEKNTYKLTCGGTEPFWSLKIKQQDITFRSPGNLKATGYYGAKTTEAAGMSAGYAFQIEASREAGKKNISLSVIQAGMNGCSDGMSDEVYKFHILAKIDGMILSGCCN